MQPNSILYLLVYMWNFEYYSIVSNRDNHIVTFLLLLDWATRTKRRKTCQNENLFSSESCYWILDSNFITWIFSCCEHAMYGWTKNQTRYRWHCKSHTMEKVNKRFSCSFLTIHFKCRPQNKSKNKKVWTRCLDKSYRA